jgi:DNA-binding response OmpR family regulator
MAVAHETKPQQNLNTIKVLIADDDPPTRMLLRAAIAQWGYEVVEAIDGEQAWQLLQDAKSPDMVILDWIMPKIDGLTLCELIKKEMSTVPYIILLTQVTGTTNIIKGLESGADEFLSKPFNMAELRSRLSVGARIVNYKNELAQQKKEIAEYLSKKDELLPLIVESSQRISDLMNSVQANKLEPEQLKKMVELQTYLKKLVETLNMIHIQK